MHRSEGRVVAAISNWFLAADHAANLAVVRITLCVTTFVGAAHAVIEPRSLPETRTIAPDLLGFVLVELPRNQTILRFVAAGLALSAVAGALGFKTRWAMTGVLVFGAYHYGVPQIFGKVDHNHHILWISVVLALSPSGDALSVDGWGRPRSRTARYGFPLRVIWILIGLTYFFPGLWKLLKIGPTWASARNMSGIMWSERLARGGYDPIVDIAGNRWLLIASGVMTLLIELGFVFLVLLRRTRLLAVFGGLGFHLGVGLTIGIWFTSLPLLYVAFIDWSPLLARLDPGRAPGEVRTDAPSTIAVATLGLLLVSVVLAGSGRTIDGWPVASYPDFAFEAKVLSSLELLAGDEAVGPRELSKLSPVERRRLLNAAILDSTTRSQLAAQLESSGICRRHDASEIAVVRRRYHAVIGDPRPAGEPERFTILECW